MVRTAGSKQQHSVPFPQFNSAVLLVITYKVYNVPWKKVENRNTLKLDMKKRKKVFCWLFDIAILYDIPCMCVRLNFDFDQINHIFLLFPKEEYPSAMCLRDGLGR